MNALAVTAIGADRPGIIARVTGVLHERGGNVTDSSMTILGGHFAIMLLVDVLADPAALEEELRAATADLGLVVRVSETGEGRASAPATHVLTLYGPDRPGIVHVAAETLASRDVNVTDLSTQVLGAEHSVYACVMEVALPAGTDAAELAATVRERVGDVEVSIHPLDVETL